MPDSKKIKCLKLNKTKPIYPSLKEIKQNPASRSAKLRFAIKTQENENFNEIFNKFKYLIDVENLNFKLMKKIFVFLPVLFLIIATTLTKNSTKKLDRKIFETKENIRVLENRFELVLLDYNFLTSPKKLMEYQSIFF